jgi:hypothetical protein
LIPEIIEFINQNNNTMENQELYDKLISVGLGGNKAKEALQDVSLTKKLSQAIAFVEKFFKKKFDAEAKKEEKKNKKKNDTRKTLAKNEESSNQIPFVGNLIYHLCKKIENDSLPHLDLLTSLVAKDQLDSTLIIDCALDFVSKQVKSEGGGNIKVAALTKHCEDEMFEKMPFTDVQKMYFEKMTKDKMTRKFTELSKRYREVS